MPKPLLMKGAVVLFLVCSGLFAAAQPVKNLVMEGAGIRGLAYCGALLELDDHQQLEHLERVAGTSAGSIVATLLAVGYSADEIATIVGHTDFGDFNDGQFYFVGGADRMMDSYGWYKGDVFEGWLESHIARKTTNPNITFGELHAITDKNYLDLYVVATNLTRQTPAYFSHETHPNMRIVDAVRASMSVPFWFEAVHLDSVGQRVAPGKGEVYIDGGVLANYPIDLFDSPQYCSGLTTQAFDPDFCNKETLGLRMDTETQLAADSLGNGLAPQDIHSIETYTTALYTMVIEGLNRQSMSEADWNRTVSISDTGIGPRVRQLEPEQIDQLVSAGRLAVRLRVAQTANGGK